MDRLVAAVDPRLMGARRIHIGSCEHWRKNQRSAREAAVNGPRWPDSETTRLGATAPGDGIRQAAETKQECGPGAGLWNEFDIGAKLLAEARADFAEE